MNQQRGGSQAIAGIVERAILIRMRRDDVGNELAKSVEHRSALSIEV